MADTKKKGIDTESTDVFDPAKLRDSAALEKNQARIRNIQLIQKRNREIRDAYGAPDTSGRGIKSASALTSMYKPSTGQRRVGPKRPQITDLSGSQDAKDLGGTYGEDFGPEKPKTPFPWESTGGSKDPQYKTKEFRQQWFTDQMKELGFDYDPKYYFHSYTKEYKDALTMVESHWKTMTKEWDSKLAESTKQPFKPVEQPTVVATPEATVPQPATTVSSASTPASTPASAANPRERIVSMTSYGATIGDGKHQVDQRSVDALNNFTASRDAARAESRRVASIGKRVAGTDSGVFMSDGGIYFGNPDQNPDKKKNREALV